MSEAGAYLAGKPCPKCGYVRSAADGNPAWQCPRCGIAYLKFAAAPARLHERVAEHGRVLAGVAVDDRSTWSLVGANLVAIAIALLFRMTLRDLMLVYWMQSVIIGVSQFVRILALRNFTFRRKDGDAEEPGTTDAKLYMAVFFVFHYGFFHFVYLMFLQAPAVHSSAQPVPQFGGGFFLCALIFAAHQSYSTAMKIALERELTPNLNNLMGLPYLRILPMHLTILAGGTLAPTTAIWFLFAACKAVADVAMHLVEQQMLRRELTQLERAPSAPGRDRAC